MLENEKDSLSRIEYWTSQFKASIKEHVALQLDAEPDADPADLRESYLINKLAVLTVANEILGERIRKLEDKLN